MSSSNIFTSYTINKMLKIDLSYNNYSYFFYFHYSLRYLLSKIIKKNTKYIKIFVLWTFVASTKIKLQVRNTEHRENINTIKVNEEFKTKLVKIYLSLLSNSS